MSEAHDDSRNTATRRYKMKPRLILGEIVRFDHYDGHTFNIRRDIAEELQKNHKGKIRNAQREG